MFASVICRDGSRHALCVLRHSAKNAQITSVSDSGTNEFPTETLSFKSAEVTLAFTPQNDDGSLGTPVTSTFECN